MVQVLTSGVGSSTTSLQFIKCGLSYKRTKYGIKVRKSQSDDAKQGRILRKGGYGDMPPLRRKNYDFQRGNSPLECQKRSMEDKFIWKHIVIVKIIQSNGSSYASNFGKLLLYRVIHIRWDFRDDCLYAYISGSSLQIQL